MPKPKDAARYQKLGGWLLCIVVIFFLQVVGIAFQFLEGGMMDVLRRWDMFIGAQGALLLAGQVVSMVLIVVYVFAAIGIVQRDPVFLRTRQLAFLLVAVNILLQVANGLLYGVAPMGWLVIALQAAGYALNFLLAMRYYARSARVRAYMGSDEYLRLAFFTKKFMNTYKQPQGGDSK
ncbi:MAG: hypothetical protein FWF60_00080 [Oscillospiraceae bacterium]|nr:hypothetical protein [Oscillospiraceae bacterium]